MNPTACPFCGTLPDTQDLDVIDALDFERKTDRKAIGCRECGCVGPEGETEADAIAAWNRRSA